MPADLESPPLAPARRRVLADEVADAIRNAIFAGRIDLGQRLIEEELATMLGVSRGPVREALARLAQEGLVELERHRGATVAELSLELVDELYSLRSVLERLAVEWACKHARAEDFYRIGAVLEHYDRLERPLSRPAVAGLDVAFHDAIFQAAHHSQLYRSWLAVRSQVFLYLVHRGALRDDIETSWRSGHEALLETLLDRKRAQVVRLVEAHIAIPYRRLRGEAGGQG